MKRGLTVSVVFYFYVWACNCVCAGLIELPGDAGGHLVSVHSPIGQSFTAEDPWVIIGLYIRESTVYKDPDLALEVRLYEGEGVAGSILDSRVITPPAGFDGYLDVDYTHIKLDIGTIYSVTVSAQNPRWVSISSWSGYGGGAPIVTGVVHPEYHDKGFHVIPMAEPKVAPVADATGPYSIYACDVLILDGSGSRDDNNDIVSYMWDLDGDGTFETDGNDEAVFDVNYTYLQSLGLLGDSTYNIYLQVTDSEGQSDINDTTLTIVPMPSLAVAVDIKPGGCPNPVNVKSSGVLPVAILGTADYDVTTIVPTSVRLAGVEPIRNSLEDVAAPVSDVNDCNCSEEGPDGLLDLTLKFATQAIVEAVGDVNDGDVLELELTGVLYDPIPCETPIEGADCIVIRGKHRAFDNADINRDGVVDGIDFAIIAENWLRSTIVEE